MMDWDKLMMDADNVFAYRNEEQAREERLFKEHLEKVADTICYQVFQRLEDAVRLGDTEVHWRTIHNYTDISKEHAKLLEKEVIPGIHPRVQFTIELIDGQDIFWKASIKTADELAAEGSYF